MKHHRIGQRCTAKTQKKGDQCGRWCAPGEVVCAKHRPDAPLAGAAALSASDDPLVILKRLTKDRDPRIRLRAVNVYLARLERKEKGCAKCKANAERDELLAEMLKEATDDERRALHQFYGAWRGAILPRRPDLCRDAPHTVVSDDTEDDSIAADQVSSEEFDDEEA